MILRIIGGLFYSKKTLIKSYDGQHDYSKAGSNHADQNLNSTRRIFMENQNSISKLIESFDSVISKNRSSFSLKECYVLEKVRLKLLHLNTQYEQSSKSQRRAIIQTIITELLKVLIDPKTWNDIKNIF